jgi:uroporphyrin-3 C-methyltransferase
VSEPLPPSASPAATGPGLPPGDAPAVQPAASLTVLPDITRLPRWVVPSILALGVVSVASLLLAWQGSQRLQSLEQELVLRQEKSQNVASEAHMLAKEARDATRDAAARTALIEARVAEVALQRGQLEDLIQSLSRSRDENVVTDIDAALRVAQQQAALTGSAEPLVAMLKSADERVARANQPRLERIRRAIGRDLERVKATGLSDISTLVARVDEAMRLADELPLMRDRLAAAGRERPGTASLDKLPPTSAGRPASSAQAASDPASAASGFATTSWLAWGQDAWDRSSARVWQEIRSLIRVSRVDRPEGMLITPEQGFFLRENLKLRLLNARAALLGRQFTTAQADLRAALDALPRYFDPESRKTQAARDLMQQVLAQSAHVTLPRPDETLAAIAAISAVR